MADISYSETVPRFAQWLRDTAYPGQHKAKRIARDWDCSESLAKQWLAGITRPGPDYFEGMVARWGKPFTDFLYERLHLTASMRLQEEQAAARRARFRAEGDRLNAQAPVAWISRAGERRPGNRRVGTADAGSAEPVSLFHWGIRDGASADEASE